MYIYTKIILDFEGNVLEKEGYEYDGPVAECKGASQEEKDQASAQKDLAKKQSAFFDTMSASFNKMFAGQTAILDTLTKVYTPIFQAGPNQYGFNRNEDRALRTMASEGTAQSYKMAKQAMAEGQAAAGGDSFIPKGADAQIRASLASKAAGVESQGQLGITQAGYEQGRQNFYKASEALGGAAHEMNPLGYSQGTTGAAEGAGRIGGSAFDMQKTIYDQNKAASGWNIAGGLLGGALQVGLGVATGGASTAISGALGGFGKGKAPASDSSFGTGYYDAPPSGPAPSGNIFGN
jgi:hypothetical protein